jgi:hypothetical protein
MASFSVIKSLRFRSNRGNLEFGHSAVTRLVLFGLMQMVQRKST